MSPVPIAVRMAQFLAMLRTHPETQSVVELSQSLTAWLSYYRLLEPLRGGANPSTVALLQRQCMPLAIALLDQAADTFCRFFGLPWLRAERTHTRLTRAFSRLCTEKGLQGDRTNVLAAMRELHARLITPGPASAGGDTPDAVGGPTPPLPADLSDIIVCLEQYLVTLLGFFEQNYEYSILRHPPPPETP